jgi:hypothetical protein
MHTESATETLCIYTAWQSKYAREFFIIVPLAAMKQYLRPPLSTLSLILPPQTTSEYNKLPPPLDADSSLTGPSTVFIQNHPALNN